MNLATIHHDYCSLTFDSAFSSVTPNGLGGFVYGWTASASSSFSITKLNGTLHFYRSSGNNPGDYSYWSSAISIPSSTGVVTIGSATITTGTITTATLGTPTITSNLYLPTSGGTATSFNYYEENSGYYGTATIAAGTATLIVGDVTAKIVRIGSVVIIKFPADSALITGGTAKIGFDTAISIRFRPATNIRETIYTNNCPSSSTEGSIIITSSGSITIDCGANYFNTGTGSWPSFSVMYPVI